MGGQEDDGDWIIVKRGTNESRYSSNKVVKHLSNYSSVPNQYNPLSPTPDPGNNDIETPVRRFTMSETITTKEEKTEQNGSDASTDV